MSVVPVVGNAEDGDDFAKLGREVSRLYGQGDYREALAAANRYVALARQKHGEEHAEFAAAVSWLAIVYKSQGRYLEAEPLYRHALAIREKLLGPDHPDVAQSLNGLANLHVTQGRYADIEPLYKRALAIREKAFGPEHPHVAETLNDLGDLYTNQGRYTDAEPLYTRALAIREKALGLDHADVAQTLNDLGDLYTNQGRYDEAEPLYRRALTLREKLLGPDHPKVATSLNNLGDLYTWQERYAEAEPLYNRALAIRERLHGPDHPDVAQTQHDLGDLYTLQARYAEAERFYTRALATRQRLLGDDNPHTAQTWHDLAELHAEQGRYREAELLYKRALAIREKALGPDHPHIGQSLSRLAALYFVQSEWERAAEFGRRSTDLLVRRARRGADAADEALAGTRKAEADLDIPRFWHLVKAVHRLASQDAGRKASLAAEMFQVAQSAHSSEAAQSLAQMAARGAKGDPALSSLVRERQDLVGEWRTRDAARTAVVSQAPDERNRGAEAANVARMAAIDSRIAEIDQRLKAEFPDYGALSRPEPLAVAEVQAELNPDEALVLFFDTPQLNPAAEETFVWVVTKTDMRWVRSDLGTETLGREIAALRCGLDETLWLNASRWPERTAEEKQAKAEQAAMRQRCVDLLRIEPSYDRIGNARADTLPFDHARAYKLYMGLFGQVQDLTKGKHLLIVPTGPLTQFPLQTLVTKPPTSRNDRAGAWLVREHAITVLPAVSSLKALRRVGKPSAAPKPMIGFGNPLLDGPNAHYAGWAKLARAKQRCPVAATRQVAQVEPRGAVARVETRKGLAKVSSIKRQSPLPETADELCAVAQDLKAEPLHIHLGAQATEREVKRLNASGELAQYRMVHFATHGVLAGQLSGAHEPGLILTPPGQASEEDDGYLSASEIAALKLDADWVILSACNTAAGAATSAEALSGLARAFIFAQARALLVSHWAVYSDATVKLITAAVREMSGDPKVGRSEALRRSMLVLIDKGEPQQAHPAYWAPFVVVGEGAAAP